jgi:AcrR family transcriptional regulator
MILDAAERLFADRGYDGTSLRDIADAVGVKVPSLYNHFPSKAELYRAVLERAWRPLFDLTRTDGQTGVAEGIIAESMALLTTHPNVTRLLYQEALHGEAHLEDLRREWVAPMFDQGVETLRSSPAAPDRWTDDEIPLLYVAFYNVFLGWFVTSSIFAESLGMDPTSPEGLHRQTMFLQKLWTVLWR